MFSTQKKWYLKAVVLAFTFIVIFFLFSYPVQAQSNASDSTLIPVTFPQTSNHHPERHHDTQDGRLF